MPDKLGKYEIRRVIGQGAMGVVYEGRDPVLDRVVAIKTIRKDELDRDQADEHTRRFLIEARAAGRLNHRNIVGIHDYGEEQGLAFIVMEFVHGVELSAFFAARHRFTMTQVVHLMVDLLGALGYSHSRGVVHRDVKPANIFVTADGVLKLADFGIARIDATTKTHAGTVLGTPGYMAPEQLRGEAADDRADLYAAGVILYQLLVGERPFSGDMVAVMQKVLMEAPKPPSAHDPSIPEAIDAIVAHALAKSPMDRFASATEFGSALVAATAQLVGAQWSDPGIAALVATLLSRGDADAPPGPDATERTGVGAPTGQSAGEDRPAAPGPVDAPQPERTMLFSPRELRQGAAAPANVPEDRTMMISPTDLKNGRGKGQRDTADPFGKGLGPVSLIVVRCDVAEMVGQRFLLVGEMRIGRSDAQIVLPDPSLSRQHAVVRQAAAGVTITDVGSVNGTFVNGMRLKAEQTHALLPGARVTVGGTELALAIDADVSMATLAGQELGDRYVLQECLHSSPKGALYRAVKKGTRFTVAIKLLAPAYLQWGGYRESFAVEAEIAAGLQHPHICRLEDHGQGALQLGAGPQVVPFLVYEMMAGGSLGERLSRLSELPTATLASWIRDLASALDYVHRKPLVHRGLKPSAVCFDADDNVYLTDFAQGGSGADPSRMFGTPAYMSPELWDGRPADDASDRYALAVIAYLLLAGVLPFEGQQDPRTRELNGRRPPPALHPRAGGRALGSAVTEVMNRALASDPARRYPTAGQFALELARAVSGTDRAAQSHHVFLSYDRASGTAWVTLIKRELERELGVRCFVDTTSLDRAESFPARIRDEIRDCEVFVCVLGPQTLQSDWVRREIAAASRHRKTMVPVMLEGFDESDESVRGPARTLVRFGGERILDRQNLFVSEALQRIVRRVKTGLVEAS